MPRFSKTLYVEVDAVDEIDAVSIIDNLMSRLVESPSSITNVDYDGPIEEVEGDEH